MILPDKRSKNRDLTSLAEEFIRAAKISGEATEKGDDKTANKQNAVLKKIFTNVQKNMDSAQEFYTNLMYNDDLSVKTIACIHSLALGISVDKADNILSFLSHKGDAGILRYNAETALQKWKTQGYLKL
jgi:hypothetical protein